MKKVLVVVSNRYNGHELWTTLGVLKHAQIQAVVVAIKPVISDEITGFSVYTHDTVDAFDLTSMKDFCALLIVSGNMEDTEAHWRNEKIKRMVEEAMHADFVIAAICCSVPTIRYAAKGKHVSPFPLIRSKELLTQAGALISTLSVSVDGKLITAENQMVTQTWAECIVKCIQGEDASLNFNDVGDITVRNLRPRKPDKDLKRIRDTWSDKDREKTNTNL